jgi:hypothetical protein
MSTLLRELHNKPRIIPALTSFGKACKKAGIDPETALKLSERGEFPPVRRLGGRRYVPTASLTTWLQEITGTPSAAA